MHVLDLSIFVVYMAVMLGIGFLFIRRNTGGEDYYVGDREMGSHHVGMSVAATDVGGEFSIDLGGLGFAIGPSGSWMFCTGVSAPGRARWCRSPGSSSTRRSTPR